MLGRAGVVTLILCVITGVGIARSGMGAPGSGLSREQPAASRPMTPMTPAAYITQLTKVQKALRDATEAIDSEEIPRGPAPGVVARRLLPGRVSMHLDGEGVIFVDNRPLIDQIVAADARHDPAGRARDYRALSKAVDLLSAQARLRAREASPTRSTVDPRAVAQAVLSQSRYQSLPYPSPSRPERALANTMERFDAWFERLFHPNRTPTTGAVNPVVVKVILWSMLALLFTGVVWLIVALVRNYRGTAVYVRHDDETEAGLLEARDKDSLLAMAEQLAKSGDYRKAFRLVYVATLVALDTGGVLRFDRSKTNWEYLRQLRGAGREDLYGALMPLTRDFDRVWYGISVADAGDYQRALTEYRALPERLLARDSTAGARAESTAR